jgi:C-terminal processing protease CtpA/Prc
MPDELKRGTKRCEPRLTRHKVALSLVPTEYSAEIVKLGGGETRGVRTMRYGGLRSFAAVGVLLGALLPGPASIGHCTDGHSADRAGAAHAPDKREAFVRRVFAIVDLVLEHHIDPPTRQEMILGGINGALVATKPSPYPDLSRRVSEVKTTRDFCVLLNDVWPAAKGSGDQFEKTFLRGMLNTVAGNPVLVSGKEARAQTQLQANRYVGLGITVAEDHKSRLPQVNQVNPGGPADAGGVREGDLIEEIDHVAVAPGTPASEVVERARGAEGTEVTLRLRSGDSSDSRTITVTRRRIMLSSVEEESANGVQEFPRESLVRSNAKPCINHLRISKISASTAHELRSLEAKLRRVGTQAVILDLRAALAAGNGIESDHAAVLLADCLLDGAPLGKLRTRHGVRGFTAGRDCVFRGWPLAILIDENTRGAAEWVVAALQDADPPTRRFGRRAIIVGVPSAGENLVRSAVPLPDRDEFLILTTGAWQRPHPNRQSGAPAPFIAAASSVRSIPATERPCRVIPDLIVDGNTGITNAVVEALWSNRRSGTIATEAAPKGSTEQPVPAVVVMRDSLRVAVAVIELQWKAARETAR